MSHSPPVDAIDGLFADAYTELRRLARRKLRSSGQLTLLDTTGLVHESYLRLVAAGSVDLRNRDHFLSYASRAMRSVVVDAARRRKAARHGGHLGRITWDTGIQHPCGPEDEVLRVHDALEDLQRFDGRMVQIVEMRYFGGLTEAEIAAALGVTERTVRREWEKARLWLAQALAEDF